MSSAEVDFLNDVHHSMLSILLVFCDLLCRIVLLILPVGSPVRNE